MTDLRSLAVQSILYQNDVEEIIRAARATSNAATYARENGFLSDWWLMLGDSSPSQLLDAVALDTIRGLVEESGGQFSYEFFDRNRGHGGGHNKLAQGGSTDLLLFLNPDGIVAPDTLAALMQTVRDDVGVADARQLPMEHPKNFLAKTGDTSWASGACAMTQRAAFDLVSGFDTETFFMYCDDVDYSWRLRLHGYRVVFEPGARLFHDKRLTTSADWQPGEAEVYYSAEAAVLLAYKYSRSDLATEILEAFRTSGDEAQWRAANEFANRRRLGTLPTQLDENHDIGAFVAGNYAVHRY
ncbi:glycosyltransferase family 2 protein [Cryobacterium algoricola]|uniref:Glycosyltransferase family 2 protein n=1 Tax=Cryobacterium algoricola TaxID=1259183 RepID=A0ABY2IAQ1_9MICO|nr:glycosyltransferase family 2 protein [Cryobacterium algoricola]TFB82583.1 glycosyltransferase family 2 protein [Cryobacterium algoricola]